MDTDLHLRTTKRPPCTLRPMTSTKLMSDWLGRGGLSIGSADNDQDRVERFRETSIKGDTEDQKKWYSNGKNNGRFA